MNKLPTNHLLLSLTSKSLINNARLKKNKLSSKSTQPLEAKLAHFPLLTLTCNKQ